jgi:hypothetical protein
MRRVLAVTIATAALGIIPIDAAADAPVGRYVVTTTTVYDNQTHLTWERTGTITTAYTYANARAFCASLGTGWRLPGSTELASLLDMSRLHPAIDPTAFPSTPMNQFWTGTPVGSTQVFVVDFDRGSVWPWPIASTETNRVRCVQSS